MYHDVYCQDTSESGFQNSTALKYKVSLQDFDLQIKAVNDYLRERKLPSSTVEFTFDDGGVSFITVVAYVLEKYGFRGKFFISTGFIGQKGFMNADQIRELENRGHSVGSHSHSHPERMISLSEQEILEEWNISQVILEGVLGHRPSIASIPNGYSSRIVLDAMIKAGIFEIYTSDPTSKVTIYNTAVVKGRYALTNSDTAITVLAIVSSSFLRLKKYIRHSILNFTKAILGDNYLFIRKLLIK